MRTSECNAWWKLPQQLRFLAAGAFNTAVGYIVFTALFLVLRKWVHYLLIGLAAHAIAAIGAFLVYRTLVFQSTEKWQPAFVRFNMSQLAGLGFGMAFLYGLVEYAHWNPLAAQAVVTAASVVLNYLLHRHFSFRRRDDVA
jgi:putative flippase GtrA